MRAEQRSVTVVAVTASPFQYSGVADLGWQTWGGGPKVVDPRMEDQK